MTTARERIDRHVKLLVGNELSGVHIGAHYVQLCFHTTANGAFVTLKDDFDVIGVETRQFRTDHDERRGLHINPDLSRLVGAVCSHVEIDDKAFHIGFGEAGSLSLSVGEDRHECLEVLFSGVGSTIDFMEVI